MSLIYNNVATHYVVYERCLLIIFDGLLQFIQLINTVKRMGKWTRRKCQVAEEKGRKKKISVKHRRISNSPPDFRPLFGIGIFAITGMNVLSEKIPRTLFR